jgi:CRP-like cAMP-binding protein
MNIESNLLITYGATMQRFAPDELIFQEGDSPKYYHQIHTGRVKMFNSFEDGKEFSQNYFEEGESFGEPVIFIGRAYPASASALEASIILKLRVDYFFDMLNEHPYVQMDIIKHLSERIFLKSSKMRDVVNNNPDSRVWGFLSEYRRLNGIPGERILIPYTRQEIANFIGLRVETVIRILGRMNDEGKVEIRSRKLFV